MDEQLVLINFGFSKIFKDQTFLSEFGFSSSSSGRFVNVYRGGF